MSSQVIQRILGRAAGWAAAAAATEERKSLRCMNFGCITRGQPGRGNASGGSSHYWIIIIE
jgi:hypothetical protein